MINEISSKHLKETNNLIRKMLKINSNNQKSHIIKLQSYEKTKNKDKK